MQHRTIESGGPLRRDGFIRFGLVFAFLLACCITSRANHQEIDLPSAIQLALIQNRNLIQSELAVASARYGIQGAKSQFAYRVVPDGSAFASDGLETFAAGLKVARLFRTGTDIGLGGGYVRIQDGDATSERASIRLQMTQPLFRNAGPLINQEPVVQAEQAWLTARRSLERQKSSLILEVVRTYETLIQLQSQIEFDRRFFNRTDNLYRLTLARERQGRATRVDTLRVKLQRGQASSRLLNNREQSRSLFLDFADLLGFPPRTTFELTAPPLVEWAVPTSNEAFAVACSNRLELAQARQDHADASRGIRIARHQFLPTLSLVARVEPFGEGDTLDETLAFDRTTWSVGIRGNTDLVNARHRSTVQRRVIDQESALQQVEIVEDAVRRDVEQAMLAFQRSRRELDIAKSNLELAGSRVFLARRYFARGREDSFSVSDAEDAFVEAQRDMLFARAEASFNGYRMLHAMGTLIDFPEDLKQRGDNTP